MNTLKVLDVTLRDGGCVNNFNFGHDYMEKILNAQEASGVDIIEMGYIDEKEGSEYGRTQFYNEQVITKNFLKHKKQGITYVAMMDYGKYDIDKLQPRTRNSIDGIRLAFHKKNRQEIISLGRKILEKGYQLFIQPMITLRYKDSELIEFIEMVNNELSEASGFYIVDSFGEMRPNDMKYLLSLVDHNLSPDMTIGFHSHNNLQMSYSNAVAMLQYPTNRNLMLDSSIMGMGKGAGNLNTELVLEHLNLFYGKKYKVGPLLEVIDKVINQLHSENYWGYAVEYYLSAINHCTPSYASHFYNKHMLGVDQVADLLGLVREDKKISFDKEYAEELYRQYNARKSSDDSRVIEELRKVVEGKKVVLIAPGKSIWRAQSEIESAIREANAVSISLNHYTMFDTDYTFITRADSFEEAKNMGKSIIVTSNITKESDPQIKVIDYKKWIIVNGGTHDSSGIVAIKLLKEIGVKSILLAGFDGFSVNINDNYYDKNLRRPVTEEQAHLRNSYFREFIEKIREKISVEFITNSLYERGENIDKRKVNQSVNS